MNIAELSTRMNVELESVNEWLSNNSLSLNVGKTKQWQLVNLHIIGWELTVEIYNVIFS